ncbi:MAG: hypothetical protein SFX73_25550 [Kofleriaceae bacterium]|nr:hypothetical protein [Kofleriaceae bacterium]
MKLVLLWLAAVGLAVATASSCSIDHRSNDLACTQQPDCTGGRVCTDGYCVDPNGGVIDAPRPPGDGRPIDARPTPFDAPMNVCPPQCSSCNAGTKKCTIDCAEINCVNTTLVCPSGWNCDIDCSVANSCRNGVNCANAASCDITCSGQGSCRQIVSGSGPMDVKCEGQSSCRGINCDASCACDVECSEPAECSFLTCSALQCGVVGDGCTSQRQGCETCP